MDRRGNRGHIPVRQHVDVVHAECFQSSHRAATCRTEADDTGPERAAIFTGDPHDLHGVQYRAVAGKFVVLMEHVQVERAVIGPVVHGLERDQGQPPVDAQLGDVLVLHAVRPAPQHLALAHVRKVLRQRLGQQDDVAVR